MPRSRILPAILIVVGVLVLAACAPGGNNVAATGAPAEAGFWLGLWHGVISPVTFIVSLFNHHVNLYEVHNNGNWYNFGFVLGLSATFGAGARSGSGSRRKHS